MLEFCLRELFEFRFMQTDPNWSNYLYDTQLGRINLLDFGACREFSSHFSMEYMKVGHLPSSSPYFGDLRRQVVHAAAQRDAQGCLAGSQRLGFLTGEESRVGAGFGKAARGLRRCRS